MALKLTRNAAEALNDIILQTLQQEGLDKAEALEDSLFSQLNDLSSSHEKESSSVEASIVAGSYAFIHQRVGTDQVLLAVVHPSRLPLDSNS